MEGVGAFAFGMERSEEMDLDTCNPMNSMSPVCR